MEGGADGSSAGAGAAGPQETAPARPPRPRIPLHPLPPSGGQNAAAEKPGEPPLPELVFGGRVLVAATAHEVDAAVQTVYDNGHAVVGFDVEWPVHFVAGRPPERIALIQLALPGCRQAPPTVLLLHVRHSGITAVLRALLEDEGIGKAGVSAQGDAHKLAADYSVTCGGLLDLERVAQLRLEASSRWSLSALVARMLQRHLPKPPALRISAWDARSLTAEQIRYAALDAWASLAVYKRLVELPLLPAPPPPPLLPESGLSSVISGPPVVIPALPSVATLPFTKLEAHKMHLRGAQIPDIASARGIQLTTVCSYLAEAIDGGHAYIWQHLGVPDAYLELIDQAVAAEAAQPTAEEGAAAADPPPAVKDVDSVLRGRMKLLKQRLPAEIGFPQLRLALAHRARQAAAAARI